MKRSLKTIRSECRKSLGWQVKGNDCRWVTLEDSGTHVCIGSSGGIEKGPPKLTGKPVPKKKKPKQPKVKPSRLTGRAKLKPVEVSEPEVFKSKAKVGREKEPTLEKLRAEFPAGFDEEELNRILVQKKKLWENTNPEPALRHYGLSEQDVASLVGAPADASVAMMGYCYKVGGKDVCVLKIDVDHPQYTQNRSIGRSGDGGLYIKNEMFFLKADAPQGTGIGVKVFSDQVSAAKAMGIKKIVTDAGGGVGPNGKPMNGYYTWPRFGYNLPIKELGSLGKKVAKAFPKAKDVLDVMKTQQGRDWWKENVKDDTITEMKFDLSEGSRSLKVFSAYLEERKKQGKSMPVRGDDLDMSEADEQALERAWERVEREGLLN